MTHVYGTSPSLFAVLRLRLNADWLRDNKGPVPTVWDQVFWLPGVLSRVILVTISPPCLFYPIRGGDSPSVIRLKIDVASISL